jgi:hypothetical protein
MKRIWGKIKDLWLTSIFESAETLTDEMGRDTAVTEEETEEILHAEPGSFEAIKSAVNGHGEQTILPDDCEFGDNDLCYVEA